MIQDFINKNFYYLYITTLLFGIILYNPIGFKSADELCAMVLLVLFIFTVFKSKDWEFNKIFLFTLFIFLFYTFYSFYIHSNSKIGIITDLIIQLKPYLAFFAVYQMKPIFSKERKILLRDISLVLWVILLPIGLIGFFDDSFIGKVMQHPTFYAAAIIALSLTYLFCGNFTLKEKIIFLVMLSLSLASGRSKIYGFVALSAVIILYFGNVSNIKLSFKNVIIMFSTFIVVCYVAWEKIKLYFLQGVTGEVEEDLLARFVLYSTSIDIFKDYFPFGSGLASFATHASGAYYSDIYVKYGIENVWGISRTGWEFIADTYYPSLAQFGIVGAFLFFLFWFYILRKTLLFFLRTNNAKYFALSMLITGYLVIENIADASFTSNRGFFMMMLLGTIMAELKQGELDKMKLDKKEICE